MKLSSEERDSVMAAKELEEQHRQLLRALYELGQNSYMHEVYVHKIGQELGLGTVQYERGRDELARLARELEEAGYIQRSGGGYAFFYEKFPERNETESQVEGFGYLALTDEGRRKVEEEELL
jgi:hypothetical protein